MKRKFLSMILVVMLVMNPVLPWMQTQAVLAANTTTFTIEDTTLYNQFKTGISPAKTAVINSDDANQSITLAMEKVANITFDLDDVNMTDADKTELGKLLSGCTDITYLSLTNANPTDIDLSVLDGRSSLKTLCLVGCGLKKVPNLQLSGLTSLCLSRNNFSEDGACDGISSANLPNLTSLYMDLCSVSNVDFIKKMNMGKLYRLSLGQNRLTNDSVTALLGMSGSLSALGDLNLGTTVHYSPSSVQSSYGSSINSITDITSLVLLPASFPKLSKLELAGLKITSLREFANVRNDISINFRANRITDFTGLAEHTRFEVTAQDLTYSEEVAKGWGNEIPELLKRVMDENDILYGKGRLKYENCSLSDDGTRLIVSPDADKWNNKPKVKVDSFSGKLSGTTFTFSALKDLDSPAVPENVTATEGDTLAKIVLPEGFTWEDAAQDVGTAGTHSFLADYTLEDEGRNYVKYGIEVPVTVKAAPVKPKPTPTVKPTVKPTPTVVPTIKPTVKPTATPTVKPTATPTVKPTATPTAKPTVPTMLPTNTPAAPSPVVTPTPKPDESKLTGNEIEKRKDLSLLLATGKQKGSNGIKLTWRKKNGCSGYEVYWSYCDGKQNYKKLKTVGSNGKRECIHKKLKKNRAYKYYIATYTIKDGRKHYQSKSPVIHVAMKKEKHTNAKKIKVNKSKVVLKVNKTFRIKATAVLENKKKKLLNHDKKFRYYVDNREVVSVSKKGIIKAKKKGICFVFVTANNGVAKQIKVTVQ